MPLTGATTVLPDRMYQRKTRCMSCGHAIEFDLRETRDPYSRRFCSQSCKDSYLSP